LCSPREGDVKGVEKITNRQGGWKIEREEEQRKEQDGQVSLALVQGAWHSEPDPLKFNF